MKTKEAKWWHYWRSKPPLQRRQICRLLLENWVANNNTTKEFKKIVFSLLAS